MTKSEKQEKSAVATDMSLSAGRLVPGRHYAIVTVGPIYHGVLEFVDSEHYVLTGAAWIVETGRLSEFVKDPAKVAAEAEFVGQVLVERGSVMAIYPTAPGEVITR